MNILGYEIEPRADLRGADLRGTNLSGADLSRAYLRGTNLSGAAYVIDGGQWRVIITPGYVQIGCVLHTVADWIKMTSDDLYQMSKKAPVLWQKNKHWILDLAEICDEQNRQRQGEESTESG